MYYATMDMLMSLPNPPFVKKFDFRGVYGKDILNQDAFYLGRAFPKTLPLKKVLLGWDTRASSKNLALNFIHGLEGQGVEISYLDKVPIDYVTAAAKSFDFDLSIMFTGSHNTWEWTGLLIHTKGGESLQGELVEKVVEQYYEAKSATYSKPEIDLTRFTNFEPEIERAYRDKIALLIPLSEIKEMRVAVDIGDGSGSKSLSILEKLFPQVTFTRLNDRMVYDATTPHQADPSEKDNMQELMDTVKNGKYDAGFAFDSDADRVLAVDEQGEYLNGSVLAGGLVDCLSMLDLADEKVGYAVEVGPSLYNAVVDLNKTLQKKVEILPIPVGRSIVRGMVEAEKIDLGVENVGHFYYKDFFMTDSGVFTLALVLYWISFNGQLSKLTKRHPDGQRGEQFVELSEGKTDLDTEMIEKITQHFEGRSLKKIEVDGQRYEIYDGEYIQTWYATRKSGYERKQKYYFGSTDPQDFAFLEEQFGD